MIKPKFALTLDNVKVNYQLTQYSTFNVSSVAQLPNDSKISIKADTGAKKHYFHSQDIKHLHQVQNLADGVCGIILNYNLAKER